MKEREKIIPWRLAVVILFIFGTGFLTGMLTSLNKSSKLEGYGIGRIVDQNAYVNIYDTASGSNASSANCATRSNASSTNASSANCATRSNASSANASGTNCATRSNASSTNASSTNCATKSNASEANVSNGNVNNDKKTVNEKVSSELVEEKVEVKSEEKNEDLTFDNSKLTIEDLKKIENATETITIDANKNTKISRELLTSISGQNKKNLVVDTKNAQFIFDGSKIKTVKDIDVNIQISNVKKDKSISKDLENGIILTFEDNKELPEGTIIRIKATKNITSVITESYAKLYFYNEEDGSYELVQTNISKDSEGYYNLKIKLNYRYVLVNKSAEFLTGSEVANGAEKEGVVSFVDSNLTYLLVIIVSIVIIIIVLVIILIVKNKKKKDSNKKDLINNDAEEIENIETSEYNQDNENTKI